ncbi:MAG TPA: dihydrodipicolinate synthase family protein [Devosiaceae bacterium]
MAPQISLPRADGNVETHIVRGTPVTAPRPAPAFNRIAYAAAHVVNAPIGDTDPWTAASIDWDATLAFRRHLYALGFKVAEAMDTAQRGMGLAWDDTKTLISRSLADARTINGADLACGAGTDQLSPNSVRTLDDVIRAYEEQVEFVEAAGGRVILMASRALARAASGPEDYARVYGRILSQAQDKVVLHWLGDMFDPLLAGYWGSDRFEAALETVLGIISDNAAKVAGIKISLLDSDREIALRRRLPEGVLCFTGDDFNYAELIEGDAEGYSHALLGIFDAIAPAASAALAELAVGDTNAYRALLEPTVALSRTIFEAPTQFYKAGVVFLAWLNGHQDHFTMLGGMQSSRGILHYAQIFRQADAAGLLADPELATSRMTALLACYGY